MSYVGSTRQVSRVQSTMSAGPRREADKADDDVMELIRKDLHGHGQPFTTERRSLLQDC